MRSHGSLFLTVLYLSLEPCLSRGRSVVARRRGGGGPFDGLRASGGSGCWGAGPRGANGGRLLCGAGVAGGCFGGVVVAGVFVLATRSLSQFLRPCETTPRLLGAEPQVVVYADDAGEGPVGAEEEVGVCFGVVLEGGELDAQGGDLLCEDVGLSGFDEGFLLLRGEGLGVEAVYAGVLVAEGGASLVARRGVAGRRRRRRRGGCG